MTRVDALRKLLAVGELCLTEIELAMGGDRAEMAGALQALRASGELVYVRDGRQQTYYRLTNEARAAAFAAGERLVKVMLPWPPVNLSPNARVHWTVLAKAKKAYREACAWTARAQGARRLDADKLHLSLVFYPPNRRAYDLDNALARMKSGLDGLADVLGVDDKHWSLSIDRADAVGGYVAVEVSRA